MCPAAAAAEATQLAAAARVHVPAYAALLAGEPQLDKQDAADGPLAGLPYATKVWSPACGAPAPAHATLRALTGCGPPM